MTIEVIFRKYTKRPCETIAIFPYEIADAKGDISSYQHIGQHGACDRYFRTFTRPCYEEWEYRDLLKELISIGYDDLKIINRVNHGRYLQALIDSRKNMSINELVSI